MSQFFSRRRALQWGAGGLVAPFAIASAQAASGPVLVELFTSQGCSDCPPVDRLAGELKSQPGLFVVSYNVDYWDYLGWKDTLGKAEYSKRQQDYAHARGDMQVYTPQMVINGERHAVGSSRAQVETAIVASRASAESVSMGVVLDGTSLKISVGELAGQAGTVWLVGVAPEISVPVTKGENKGTKIIYHNVARRLASAGEWQGAAKAFTIAVSQVIDSDCKSCFAILQQGKVGRVLGLGALAF